MPSDDRIFEALTRPRDAFRSALASTIEELRGSMESRPATDSGARGAGAGGLGAFAVGRIDVERFEALTVREAVAVEPIAIDRVQQTLDVLQDLAARGDGLFRVDVESGGNLSHAVASGLAEVGRAFGAARVADLSRTGCYQESDHAAWLDAFPFARWNGAERNIAPPLVVHVDGADAHAEGLAGFLDGAQKIVLVVRGEVPPALLARLITPGVFVVQTKDEAVLDSLAAFDGPGILAFVPEGASLWVHDPDAGSNPWDRLRVESLPGESPTKPLGGLSPFQQSEPLRQIEALSRHPEGARGQGPLPPSDPIDKLAAWLLTEADLSGLE